MRPLSRLLAFCLVPLAAGCVVAGEDDIFTLGDTPTDGKTDAPESFELDLADAEGDLFRFQGSSWYEFKVVGHSPQAVSLRAAFTDPALPMVNWLDGIEPAIVMDASGGQEIQVEVWNSGPNPFSGSLRVTVLGDLPARAGQGLKAHNCMACHAFDRKLVGPSFQEIGRRYAGQADPLPALTEKVLRGGSGTWGQIPMPPNSLVPAEDLRLMLRYILSLR